MCVSKFLVGCCVALFIVCFCSALSPFSRPSRGTLSLVVVAFLFFTLIVEKGLDKKETVEKHGKDQVQIWRRSYTTPPPLMADDRYLKQSFAPFGFCPGRLFRISGLYLQDGRRDAK